MWILCEYRLYYTETEMSLFWWNSPSEVKLTNSNETNDENFVKMTTFYVLMLLFFVISLSFIFMVESDTFSMNMFVILCNDILFATCLVSVCVKPGLYFSRRQSPTVARLGDRRRQSRVCLYFNWRLSPAQVGDCRQQSPTVVFKVQQCWTFNAVASSRWHFPSNQRATTGFIRSRPMQTKEHKLLLNI